MNTEQKAKAYDKALDRARKLYNGEETSADVEVACETIFPELKESEDEKIRKAILGLVRQSSEILGNQNQNNMISWLEKQGEQKLTEITKKEIINKACEWIEKNKHFHKELSFGSLSTDWDKFIREFRKAMEE